jgi:hypothetical protein
MNPDGALHPGTRLEMRKNRPHLYFPGAEGFGETYRRVMLNDYFQRLICNSSLRAIAEMPLDDYGVVGAGSVVFAQLGCQVYLVSDDESLLVQAPGVFRLNGLEMQVRPMLSNLHSLAVPDNVFDLGWNFDRLLALESRYDFLREMVRVCKVVFITVPNARNYGQYFHFVYHRLQGTTCPYVEPRDWMLRKTLRQALESLGMEVIEEGLIDVPWWPGFPELPDLVRAALHRKTMISRLRQNSVPPATEAEEQQWLEKVWRASFIEQSRLPEAVRQFFAHNVYVLAAKPQHKGLIRNRPGA